jgi:hypothetical protein
MTLYTGIPTFEERSVAATLVIVGRVEKVVDLTTDYVLEQPQVRTTFQVSVESVFKGEIDDRTVNVQIAGGKSDKTETPWSVLLKEGELALFMLNPNYANQSPDVFVPYFGSCYLVSSNGDVQLSDDVAKQFANQKYSIENATVKLADLHRLVDEVVKRQEKQKAFLIEFEPSELLNKPYREIIEMPQADFRGARSASPENQFEYDT